MASEAGLPAIRNFSASDYGGSPQNWAITQAANGVIYAANSETGVLAFDGERWRRIAIPNQLAVRSLAAGVDGRIWVGGVGELGYLAPDGRGKLVYVSLLDKVPADQRNFADVWRIHVSGQDVWFATISRILHLRAGRFSVVQPTASFHLSFLVNDTVYVREVGRGLMRVVNDRLALLAGSERFADERIYALLPWHGAGAKPGELLVGTRSQGWFIWDGSQFQPWHTDADAAMQAADIYDARWLADGRLAVISLHSGLFVLDTHGHLLNHFTRASGLATDVLFALYQDRQRGLWLGTDNGITRIDVAAPVTHFGERSALRGSVLAITRHLGTLYVGTSEGLYRLVSRPGRYAAFEELPGARGQNWGFAEVADQLLVVRNNGVSAVRRNASIHSLIGPRSPLARNPQSLLRLARQPARVLVGYQNGVGVLHWNGQRWVDEGEIAKTQGLATGMVEDARGRVWVTSGGGGVDRLEIPADWQGPHDARPVAVEHFDTKAGVPTGQQVAAVIGGEARFVSNTGILRFDAATGKFQADPAYAGLAADPAMQINLLDQDQRGVVWAYRADSSNGRKETGRLLRDHDHWRWAPTPLQRLNGGFILAIHTDPDGVTWLGGEKGVYRYDPARQITRDPHFAALLREVSTRDGKRLRLAGQGGHADAIAWTDNALRFSFAAPSYADLDANRYQVYLDGVDPGWSPWSADAYRDYTNLQEGRYRFRVRARNGYGEIGGEADFDFRILPPWYRSWWAWTLWLASALVLLGLFVRWRSAALHRRNRALAQLVHERTAALQQANDALAEQSVTDPLTGLKNRRYLYDHIQQELAMTQLRGDERRRQELALDSHLLFLMVDIDHFKHVNDTWGHAAGDRVLQQLRDILLGVIRDSDFAIRWGGEEFLIVTRFAPDSAGPEFAERIRAAVAGHYFDIGENHTLQRSCSIGFASYPACAADPDALNWEQVVSLADECLYAAKRHGRNAWAGVLPLPQLPAGAVSEALQQTLDALPGPGPLPVVASWVAIELPLTAPPV